MINETFNELSLEIARMENLVLYFQNRILRKQIALEELFHAADCALESPTAEPALRPGPDPAQGGPFRKMNRPSAAFMIRDCFAQEAGVFWYPQIKSKLQERWPEDAGRVRKGIYATMQFLLDRGEFMRAPGGFRSATQTNGGKVTTA
jgi:hypothetical protein